MAAVFGHVVVLFNNIQHFSDKSNPLETSQPPGDFNGGEYRARTGDLLHAKQEKYR